MRSKLTVCLIALALTGLPVTAPAQTQSLAKAPAEITHANDLIRREKYAEAKTVLEGYLKTHAGDRTAAVLLGVADAYAEDPAGAAKAFDGAGPIPERYKVIAAKAYSDAAVNALKEKNYDDAIALSSKALAIAPNVNVLYIQGTAYTNAQRYSQAIPVLEKAKSLATAGFASAPTINAIDATLMTAYVFGGDIDKGLALGAALKKRDPGNARVDDTLAAYYSQQASAAVAAGKKEDAVTVLENAAKNIPSRATTMYVQAANILATGSDVDWKRVKAEADKALAIDPNNARANFTAGIALANARDPANAIVLLQKAKANAGADTALTSDIDAALRKLGTKP